ncbi:MAG: hypothetical protein QOI95_568 [Acidimicrobiaceae bacterium]|jgi:Ca2+-binding RTX toxin-like protein
MRRRFRRLTLAATIGLLATLTSGLAAEAAPTTTGLTDTHAREWRQVFDTTGLSWNQVATVCPTDGVTPCSGNVGGRTLTGWVWATDAQVLEFMSDYAPDLATANPPQVGGADYFGQAVGFLGVMHWTIFSVTNYSYSEWTGGWTASRNSGGAPIGAGAGYSWPPFSGGLGLGPVADANDVSPYRGVWLWRVAGLDYSPPVITPTVSGAPGNNGWYVSNVSVQWGVQDTESAIDSTNGCDPSTVASDTAAITFACEATSVGGTSRASTVVKRDTVPPTVSCPSPVPVFTLGQSGTYVTATVTDATSGPATATAISPASTDAAGSRQVPVTGADLAGSTTTTQCRYDVVVPPCRGLMPTIIGTAGNDVINGTAGRDVILALGGNDTIKSANGNDVICGGDGNDIIDSGAGQDIVDGGAGNDDITGGLGNDDLDGGLQSDSIRAGDGKDVCTSGEVRMSSCEVIKA